MGLGQRLRGPDHPEEMARLRRAEAQVNLQLAPAHDERVVLCNDFDGITDQFVNDCLCALPLIDNRRGLAHEEWSCIVQSVIIDVIAHVLNVVLDGNMALGGQLLDLSLPVLFPILDVGVSSHTQGATSEDDGSDVVVKTGGAHGFLVGLGSAGFFAEDKSGTDPDSAGTEREGSGQGLSIEYTTCGDDLDRLASHGALYTFAESDDLWNQDRSRNVSGVATSFATLSADHVHAEVEALLDVLGVSDHVHVENAGLMETVDHGLGWDTDGRDEEAGARLDDDVDELVELALGVVVVGLSCAAADLGKQEVNTEGRVLVLEKALELGNLLSQHVRSVSDTSDHTDTTGVGDGGGELRTSSDVHASKHDGVVDLQEVSGDGAKLLGRSVGHGCRCGGRDIGEV